MTTKVKYSYWYPKNVELAKKLVRGDYDTIATASYYSKQYIKKIFTGQRNNEDVLKIAKDLIKNRQAFIKKHACQK